MKAVGVLRFLWKSAKWSFVALLCLLGLALVFAASLFFRPGRIPGRWVEPAVTNIVPAGVSVKFDSVDVSLRDGVTVRGLKVYESTLYSTTNPVLVAESVTIDHALRRVHAVGLRFPLLPDSYYAPGNSERNARLEAELPSLDRYTVVLERPEVLGVAPKRLIFDVSAGPHRADFDRIRLDWDDESERMFIDGFCWVDLDTQRVYGEVRGLARQPNIRPLLVALDVPVSLPYFDGFTGVTNPVPSLCRWNVNLVNNDFDLWLDLKPTLGEYNGVPMDRAAGLIHLHNYIRGEWLNFRQTIGPVSAVDADGRPLDGTVVVAGTNGFITVDVDAKSAMRTADILKIGGFTGKYVDEGVVGELSGRLQFRFPRAMTNNYELLDGEGHLKMENGHLARINMFSGLTDLLANRVPGVKSLVDQSYGSCDYTIEKGVLRTDNARIDGTLFSIRMSGTFDCVKDNLDFTVRVQFTKNESFMAKLASPITWTFSKLLMEFRLTGSAQDPKWEYVSVLDRVMDVIQ